MLFCVIESKKSSDSVTVQQTPEASARKNKPCFCPRERIPGEGKASDKGLPRRECGGWAEGGQTGPGGLSRETKTGAVATGPRCAEWTSRGGGREGLEDAWRCADFGEKQ